MNSFKRRLLLLSVCVMPACVPLLAGVGFPQEDEVTVLKKQLREMQQQMQKMVDRIEQLERGKAADAATLNRVEGAVQSMQRSPSALNPAIGVAIDATAEHKDATGGNFALRAAELGLSASVDPFARAYAFVTGSNEEVELEEAAMVTSSLPWNTTLRGGKFFADFGRLAKFHQHELPFVNAPLSLERMVGGESVAIGAEANYLVPKIPFFLRLTGGTYNKIGEENERLEDDENRTWSRFTYLGRAHSYYDLTDDLSIDWGATFAYTPKVASGSDRSLGGIDLTLRHKPLAPSAYIGTTLGGELFVNSERFERDSGVFKRQKAYGGYGYAQVDLDPGFHGKWSAGFLVDSAPDIASPGIKTTSYSPYLAWWPSEFNRLRLQYTYGDDNVREEAGEGKSQVFLQWTTVIGSHTHGFRTR